MSVNWRSYGDTTLEAYIQEFTRVGSPMLGEAKAVWEAAKPHSKLMLAMSFVEQKHATLSSIPADYRNPLSLARPNGTPADGINRWMRYSTWEQGVGAWKDRITSPTYKDGVYARTVTLADLIREYAPPHDRNDTNLYIDTVQAIVNRLPTLSEETPPVPELTFGKVAKPKIETMIVEKAYDGAGFNYVPPRRCVGVCTHITDGIASLEWYYDFFSVGGGRANDALTDFGIDKAGRIAMWNDPFGNRSPWASGGSDGLEGDGPLFVRTLGIHGINGAIASMEHVARSPEKMTDAQLEASAQLTAWIFDGASNHPRATKVPWSAYPLNPSVGCVTHMAHYEFATKPCPGPGIVGQIPALQDRVRAIMKRAQEGESQETVPPPKPVEPDHGKLPNGWTEAQIAKAFGTGTLVRPGKADSRFKFHLGRAWAEAYVERAGREKVLPAVTVWRQVETDRDSAVDLISFANGWLLLRFTDRGGFRWL